MGYASVETTVVAVAEPSDVGHARRRAAAVCNRLGFDETRAGNAALVVTEMAGNLVKHGRGGQILLREIADGAAAGIEILALDAGPGIADVPQAMRDGHSTAGSPGTGLGAVARAADAFDLYSRPGAGTVVLARVWARPPEAVGRTVHGVVSAAKPGETVAGDGWCVFATAAGARVLVADGLGHGPLARDASEQAIAVVRGAAAGAPLADVVDACHGALRGTRGAALGIADVDCDEGSVRFVGVGNVAGCVMTDGTRQNLVSMNGSAGHPPVIVREFRYAWTRRSLLLMASDGLTTRWGLDAYPGLSAHEPGLIAGVLYRDHRRGRDDATVLALRERTRGTP